MAPGDKVMFSKMPYKNKWDLNTSRYTTHNHAIFLKEEIINVIDKSKHLNAISSIMYLLQFL